ncbi:glycosyl hydrolase family 8 [Nocardioides aequoreus]|uniref:glycosyl hydrolase family 8 n=1 Tax=Nocardioides aequoreus TaxID=397278 RepID=UPI0009FE422A|nr:glycosyl hydrolase family 8 [Nocardioides aequoreus]
MGGARARVPVGLLCLLLVAGCGTDDAAPTGDGAPVTAAGFLATYVDDDGRVVRRDQGGDTVSEGQAYAMLIALTADDQETFDRVWGWTRDHLTRDDGLFSWHWADGAVVDEPSASDAEVDMARALLLAGDAWGGDYRDQAVALGGAVLDHLTVEVPAGRLLVAGQWATEAPYTFNPSYVSPVATAMLAEASGDPRWAELEAGSRAALASLPGDQLPPDWAEVGTDGVARATGSPDGSAPPAYSYDAARLPLRLAESCVEDDTRLAASVAALVARHDGDPVARYDLQGAPQSDDASPLVTMAQAAGLAAGGDTEAARSAVAAARDQQRASPTYYGDAWTVLAPALLTDPDLGGCPPLG